MELSRRAFVVSAAALLAGCSLPPGSAGSPGPSAETSPKPATGTPSSTPLDPAPETVQELFARPEFYIAHRGSGDNWPEHTLKAYTQSLVAGAGAAELSVRATSDGVLVCHHDADTERVTGTPGVVKELTYKQISALTVDARRWLGPATPLEPIPKLEDVLAALPKGALAFVEDKDGTNSDQLLDLLDAQPGATSRFVWKQWAPASQVRSARERGYATWGYFGRDIHDRIEEIGPEFDSIGVEVSESDEYIKKAVATGRPVIAWEVHRRSDRDRLQRLGVRGMMCSNVPHVMAAGPRATEDSFATGRRAAGDLPFVADRSWGHQPRIDAASGIIRLDQGTQEMSYLMGSLGPITDTRYTLRARIAVQGTDDSVRGGLAFCLPDDQPYSPDTANTIGGYQIIVDRKGAITLAEHPSGWEAPKALDGVSGTRQTVGQPVDVIVEVGPQRLTVRRGGSSDEFRVVNLNHRGGYLQLWADRGAVDFSEISVS